MNEGAVMRFKKYLCLTAFCMVIAFTITACGQKKVQESQVEETTSNEQKDPKDMTQKEYVAYLESKDIKTDNTILGTFYGRDFADGISLNYLIENGDNYNAVVEGTSVNLRFGAQDITAGDAVYAEYNLYDCQKKLGLVDIDQYGDHNISQYVIEQISSVDEDINWRGCTGGCSVEQFKSACGEPTDIETPYDNVVKLVYLTDTHYIEFRFSYDALNGVQSYLIEE